VPLLIFGISACISGIVATALPETKDCHLPATIEEAEDLGRKKVEEKSES